MLARFKWLIAAAGFLIQYMVLPMLPGISVYPDLALAAVCALGLIYGPGAGMFYGCCVGVLAGSLFTLSLARTALTYALLGLVCGFMSFKARSSRMVFPGKISKKPRQKAKKRLHYAAARGIIFR